MLDSFHRSPNLSANAKAVIKIEVEICLFQPPAHDIAQLHNFVVNHFLLTQTSAEKLFKLLNIFAYKSSRANQVVNH